MKSKIQVRNKISGLSLIELLVVIAILGIIGVMAFPNLRDYLDERKVRNNVYDITILIDEVKNQVYNGPYAMGIIDFKSNSSQGVTANIKYRSQELFNNNKNCNMAGSWINPSQNKDKNFKELKSSKSSPLCVSKEGNHSFSDSSLIFCSSANNTGSTCNTFSNSTYRVNWNRLGNYEIYKYSEITKTWIPQKQ